MRKIWKNLTKRRRNELAALLGLMILASIAEVVSIGAVLPLLAALTEPEKLFNHSTVQPLVRYLDTSEPRDLLLPLTVLFIAATIFSSALRMTLMWLQIRLGHAIGADLSFSAYQRALYQPYQTHLSRNSSQIVAGIYGKVNDVLNQTIMPWMAMISGVLVLALILGAMVIIDPWIAIVAYFGFAIIYFTITILTKERLAANSLEISKNANRVIKVLQEALGGIRDILIDGTQQTYCQHYRVADESLRRARAKNQTIAAAPRYFIEALVITLLAILSFAVSKKGDGFAQSIPTLGALALSAQRLLPVMQLLFSSWASIKGGRAALDDVLALLDQPLPEYLKKPPTEPIKFENKIQLKCVSFAYSERSAPSLSNICLEIERGTRIGLMGNTGSGKSTLLDIIMGLLPVSAGVLEVDGVTIDANNCRAWQANIAHVPQSIFLADTSLAENIAFGISAEKIDISKVKLAAQKAQIAEFIESLEHGYQTNVGERGIRLSGGQRQRIGIARALYKEAKIIVLDEATSALDGDTENAVMQAIREIDPEITILMVAHRLSTLNICDQVYEVINGGIQKSMPQVRIAGSARL